MEGRGEGKGRRGGKEEAKGLVREEAACLRISC